MPTLCFCQPHAAVRVLLAVRWAREFAGGERDVFVSMEYIGHQNSYSYYFDTVSDVMYIYYRAGYSGGITVLLDTDGKPLTHTKYVELCAERAVAPKS